LEALEHVDADAPPSAPARLAATLARGELPGPVPRALRDGVAGWLLTEAKRRAAWLERLDDPTVWSPRCDVATLRGLARRDALRALDLAEDATLRRAANLLLVRLTPARARGEHLAALLADAPTRAERVLDAERWLALGEPRRALASLRAAGEGWRASWARARAQNDQGRYADALGSLNDLGPRLDDPRVWAEVVRARAAMDGLDVLAAQARMDELKGSKRAEADAILQQLRRKRTMGSELVAGCNQILALDPHHPVAPYYLARGVFFSDPPRGFHDCVIAVERCPWLFPDLIRLVAGTLAEQPLGFVKAVPLSERADEIQGDDPDAVLARGVVLTMAVELQAAGPEVVARALAELTSALEHRPGSFLAWACRGFLHTRAGRYRHAERDLEAARELYPRSAVLFVYRALLGAATDAPASEVQGLFERASAAGYDVWSEQVWTPEAYPELRRLRRELRLPPERLHRNPGPLPDPAH
jgi:tetratricopeptide (TPR) repeat protein